MGKFSTSSISPLTFHINMILARGQITITSIHDGRDGKSSAVRKLDTHVRKYDSAKWEVYAQSGRRETWNAIANVRDFNTGDTAYLEGIVTDRGNAECMLFGEVVGKNGSDITLKTTAFIKDGNNGTDAYSVDLTPSEIVFETDINGTAVNPSGKPAALTVRRGSSVIQPTSVSITRLEGCTARFESGKVIITTLARRDGMSVPTGYVNLRVTADGNTFEKQLVFTVNTQAVLTSITAENGQIRQRVEKVESENASLTTSVSQIRQQADRISLELTQRRFSGINLLKGAGLRSENLTIETDTTTIWGGTLSEKRIELTAGYRCAYIKAAGHTADTQGGLFFVGRINGRGVYTLSFRAQLATTPDRGMKINACLNKTMNTRVQWLPEQAFVLLSNSEWNQYTFQIEVPETTCPYLEISIRLVRNGEVRVKDIQLEEGTVATAWKDPDTKEALKNAGLHIDLEKFIATTDNFVIRNSKGEENLLVDEHGMVNAKLIKARTLETLNQGRGSVRAENGVLEVLNPQGKVNIRFGLVNGLVVLAYYDNSGKLLYTLGPDGMSARDITEEKFLEKSFAEINPTIYPVAKMEDIVSNGSLMRALFARKGSHTGNALRDVILYQYTAGRVGNEVVRGLWADTPSQALGANGRYFPRIGNVASTPYARGFFAEESYAMELIGAVPQDYSRYERYYAVKVNFNQGSFKRRILVLLDGLPATVEVYSNTIY